MGHPVTDAVAFLRGSWLIDRTIVDSLGGVSGAFTGTAEFVAEGHACNWVEAGELQWAAQTHRAGRRLLVAVRPDVPCIVDVAFDDGKFFYRADLSSGSDAFVHGCAPDTYSGSWTVDSADRFRLTWDVEGPAKQITIRSTYSRA
jgi:Family of unknown function (DUF6314)